MRPSFPAPIIMWGNGLDPNVGNRVASAEPRSRSFASRTDALKGVKKSASERVPLTGDNFRYELPQSGPPSQVPLPVAAYTKVPSDAKGPPQIPPCCPFGVRLKTAVCAKLLAEYPKIHP